MFSIKEYKNKILVNNVIYFENLVGLVCGVEVVGCVLNYFWGWS